MKPLQAFARMLAVFVDSDHGTFTEEELRECNRLMQVSGYSGAELDEERMLITIYRGLIGMLNTTLKVEEEIHGSADIIYRLMGEQMHPEDLIQALMCCDKAAGTMIQLDGGDPAATEMLNTLKAMAQDQEMDLRAERLRDE